MLQLRMMREKHGCYFITIISIHSPLIAQTSGTCELGWKWRAVHLNHMLIPHAVKGRSCEVREVSGWLYG